ncbi:MAG: RNA methyltransferase [Mariprofundus sp.]|nr:RNA methyltransferase [Mariprofundus sp.]
MSKIAVALLHYPILNRHGETSTTAITSIDVHDFARSCAFYDVDPVYLVHPAPAMHALIDDMNDYYINGAGGDKKPARKIMLESIRCVYSLQDALDEADYQLWYTSAEAPEAGSVDPSKLLEIEGNHLIVFGTGWGLDVKNLPPGNGWLSPIEGVGRVRHLSVRGALAIYLDRLRR